MYNTRLTVKDLERVYKNHAHFVSGYCCEYKAPCGKNALENLGYNAGVYGWNWTLYYCSENDTIYCSYYRNVPNRFIDK